MVVRTVASAGASAGDADPGKEGLGGWGGRARSNTPSLIRWMGGRIVYASRIPPRPHEAQRLGGFDAWRGRYLEKLRILVGLE